MDRAILERIDHFVDHTRSAIFVRPADRVLMIRPDKTLRLNHSAVEILSGLYNRDGRGAAQVLPELARRLGTDQRRLLADTDKLVRAASALLNEELAADQPALRFAPFERRVIEFPTLAEIALTYGCQNRCRFCYASSPRRVGEHHQMTTAQVRTVMDRIFTQAHVPSLSFTGGEATLRPDLPELIRHGVALGFRVNLITNGIRTANPEYARSLVDAGLHSAQVSLEAADAACHDAIVGRPGAHAATVAGVNNLRRLGIHVHTNTTLCPQNLGQAGDLIRFLARRLELRTMSMNMVIRTGAARGSMEISYREIAAELPGLLAIAAAEGIRLVWYSPIPYCIFNPVLHDLGAKACACVDGILSVDPSGQVLPCSSFADGLGSLLEGSFDRIYRSRTASYWREKRFVPPVCRSCADVDLCGGACPLYWDAAGSFAELPLDGADDPGLYRRWQRHRRRGGSFGVPAAEAGSDVRSAARSPAAPRRRVGRR